MNLNWCCRGACLASVFLASSCVDSTLEGAPTPEHVESSRQSVVMDRGDLNFLIQQIRIAEQHAAGAPIQSLVHSPKLQYGLRTVSGAFNNIVPGQELFGSADRPFPRLLSPVMRPAEPALMDPDGPGPLGVGSPTSYNQTSGLVFDSQPRIISNLIVDQTTANPAAVAAAAQTDGSIPDVDGRGTFFIPNVTPDMGISAPFNAWFILFGQFFDHGLDLVDKGKSGTVFVPLQPDDPLFVEGSPTNFMVLDRATNQPGPDGILGTADDVRDHMNRTSPFVDQNQTYTSHPSHQVFLREYAMVGGKPVATGRMHTGARGGIANWGETKLQARTLLGIDLTDRDALSVPLLATDPYGKFLPGPNGFPQLVTPGGLVEGNPAAPISTATATRTGSIFLVDVAHRAVPSETLTPDPDTVVTTGPQPAGTYDNELLDLHFVTGDGRGNENIGLTAVHTMFHAEHNRLVGHVKNQVLASADPLFIAEWLVPGANQADGIQDPEWNGERLFQAARFGTEMQYQHLVFEEIARKVQPEVNLFAGYDTTIDPAIFAEFAHTVYRFGHTMLTENIARTRADGTTFDIGLIQAFLNPTEFTASGTNDLESASVIIRGMTRQVGNEVDEFVTSALRNNLLGLPLDLPTLNLTRGRDTGIPPLNDARRRFFADTGNSALRPYVNWTDFGFGIRHPESLVNFIAAYGTHPTITAATTTAAKRAAALAIVLGGDTAPPDSVDFLNSTGTWADRETGLNLVDFWIGGLAEKQMLFGGLLGSTFNFVFEKQMERLQDGDRLYYLHRNRGLNFFTQLEQNTFAEFVMRNTDVKHLPADIFSRPAFTFEIANLGTSGPILDDPATPQNEAALLMRMPDGTVRYTGLEHVVFGGTPGADKILSSEGDDTVWGDEGNDRIEGGDGVDMLNGGDGDDIITDIFGIDVIKGNAGNDVINGGPGNGDILLGGDGSDFIIGGTDVTETFGGQDNDFIFAGDGADTVFAGEGDDWIEGGGQADLLQGDNGEPFQVSPIKGNDVIFGQGGDDDYDSEGGDDIMVSDDGIERHEGMLGFDWVSYKGDTQPADADLLRLGLLPPDLEDIRDRFDLVEGLSGWDLNDKLRGDDRSTADLSPVDPIAHENHALNNAAQIARVDGLQAVLGAGVTSFDTGNIILGGAGSDLIQGRGGDDILDGDRWLNVRLSVVDGSGTQIATADGMSRPLTNKTGPLAGTPATLTLQEAMFAGTLNPGQLRIIREILTAPAGTDVDTAVYSEPMANYDITLNGDGSLRVAHTRGSQLDGVDRLLNIERLQFSDVNVAVDIITDAVPPAPVTSLLATPGNGLVTLKWTNPADAVGALVLRSTSGFAADAWDRANQTLVFNADGASCVDVPPVSGTLYFYTVYARDLAGNYSLAAATVSVPVAPLIKPAPVTALAQTVSDSQVELTWHNPAETAGVRILRSTVGFASLPTETVDQTLVFDASGTLYTDTGLTNGTSYYYTLFAKDPLGNFSNPVTIAAVPSPGTGGATDDPNSPGDKMGCSGSSGDSLAGLFGLVFLAAMSRRRRS